MYRSPCRGKIRPKLSTMPTQRSEARVHLNVYKLAVEKERLEQELINLETRSKQLKERLNVLNHQMEQELSWAEKSRDNRKRGLGLQSKKSNSSVKTVNWSY